MTHFVPMFDCYCATVAYGPVSATTQSKNVSVSWNYDTSPNARFLLNIVQSISMVMYDHGRMRVKAA
jgi:hypothetical protein